ncbi:MAG TPA: universal stress protein [Propionibacteriaceae bacterium]|jgi:nucleotide-binding universal stress UspA family protein|nr:universal stress protein [Propionibacteriaceae bacterium]
MAENQGARRILVGVTYGQSDVVLRHAARFARTFDAALVCAHVDPGRYVVEELPDGSVASLPLDPDLPELKDTDFDQGLVAQVRAAVADDSVDLSFRELAGDVGYALTRLADILDVEMIIVGSRRGGVRAGLKQFLTGSVAAHLAHRQPRPVVVIPVAPVAEGKPLPWEE